MWKMQPEHLGVVVGKPWRHCLSLPPCPAPQRGPGGHTLLPGVDWTPCTGRGQGGRGLYGALWEQTRDVSSGSCTVQQTVPQWRAVESPGPKAWVGLPQELGLRPASHWSRAPGRLTFLCKAGDGRGRQSSPEEIRTLRPLLGSGPMREPWENQGQQCSPGWEDARADTATNSTPTRAHLRY